MSIARLPAGALFGTCSLRYAFMAYGRDKRYFTALGGKRAWEIAITKETA